MNIYRRKLLCVFHVDIRMCLLVLQRDDCNYVGKTNLKKYIKNIEVARYLLPRSDKWKIQVHY